MGKPNYKAKTQCEDNIENNFAIIIQQGLSSTLQALKSQLNNKPLPGNRFCWSKGIGLHLQLCQLDIGYHGKSLICQAATISLKNQL